MSDGLIERYMANHKVKMVVKPDTETKEDMMFLSGLFESGRTVVTSGVSAWMDDDKENTEQTRKRHLFVLLILCRHVSGDWGLACFEDVAQNEYSLGIVNDISDRLMSTYEYENKEFWIITEWDRSTTTVLFPSEY